MRGIRGIGMLIDILKDKRFDYVFSVLMGLFLAILIRPSCKGDTCFRLKAPPLNEINENAYKISDRCYKFVPVEAQCPSTGVIEPFAWSASKTPSK